MKSRQELLKTKKICKFCQASTLPISICSIAILATGAILQKNTTISTEQTSAVLGIGAVVALIGLILDKIACKKEFEIDKQLNTLDEMGIK